MTKIILEGVVGEVYDWLQDELKATSYKGLTAQMKDVSDDIELHINSKGGDAFEGIAIMNALKKYDKGTKTAIVDGFCASAATLPLFAMDKVQAHETSLFVFHKGATVAMGHADDIRKTADDLDTIDDLVIDLYMSKFTGSRDELVALLDYDKIISAKQALEYGFVDELISNEPAPALKLDATERKIDLDTMVEEHSVNLENSFLSALHKAIEVK